VINKIVVQFIRSNGVFRFLRNRAVRVRRQKFWAYWRVYDVAQSFAVFFFRDGLNNIFYKRFWDRAIHIVVAHVVAVVCAPAKRKFAQIARANHNTALFVRNIKQEFACVRGLARFRTLCRWFFRHDQCHLNVVLPLCELEFQTMSRPPILQVCKHCHMCAP